MKNLITLTGLLEESMSDKRFKNFSGNLRSIEDLQNPEVLKNIDDSHSGFFAIIVHDPSTDYVIQDYLKSNYLKNDTSKEILALFCSEERTESNNFKENTQPIQIEGSHPSYTFARELFNDHNTLPLLPGIVFLERLNRESEPIFISMTDDNVENIRMSFIKLFNIALESFRERGPDDFSEKLTLRLASSDFKEQYVRTGKLSTSEAFLKFWFSLLKFKSDIFSILKLF